VASCFGGLFLGAPLLGDFPILEGELPPNLVGDAELYCIPSCLFLSVPLLWRGEESSSLALVFDYCKAFKSSLWLSPIIEKDFVPKS
jgi:hypothetical protein